MRQIFFLILLLFPYIAHSTDIKFKENLQNLPNEFFWDGLRFEKRTINDYEKDSEGLGYSAFYSGECSISLYIYDYNTYYFEETDVVGLKRYDDGKAPINLFNIPLETIHAYADIKKRLPDLEPRVPTFEEGFAYTPIFYKIKSEYKGQEELLLKSPPVFVLVGQTSDTIEGVGTTIYQNNFLKMRMTCHNREYSEEKVGDAIKDRLGWLVNELNTLK